MRETGAAIIAHAIGDAGASIVTNVPGFGGTQVFEALCEASSSAFLPSFHEEVAYSIAHGGSLVGQRSVTLIKAHGLAKAANSVVDSLSAGTTAGFVVLVFDDKLGKHSDSIFDVAALLQGLGIPYRTLQLQGMYREILDAFTRSEALQLPVALLVDTDDLDRVGTYVPVHGSTSSSSYQRDVLQHVVCPLLAGYQRQVLDAKLSGQDWRLVKKPALPKVPDGLPEAYRPIARSYVPLFEVFRKLRGRIVTGDTSISSLFAFPPYDCVDIETYMGGSIPLAIGAYLAGCQDTWALTGDFSFVAAGHLGLVEAIHRNIPLRVLIFNNGRAEATGGQPVPDRVLESILRAYEPYLRRIRNPEDAGEVEDILTEGTQAREMRIVVANYRE